MEVLKTAPVTTKIPAPDDPLGAFLVHACVPLDDHRGGDLAAAEAVLAAHPGVRDDVFAAAALGDDVTVARLVAVEPARATSHGGPYGWDPLTYLCFSRYLRLEPTRPFVRAAERLLEAGASPNTGFQWEVDDPRLVFESAIYGAAGVASHAPLARLLLDRGADPNDEETAYHVAEGYDHTVLDVLLASKKLGTAGLATLLVRKLDWHDRHGVVKVLDHGADPNFVTHWGRAALHHATSRANELVVFELLLARGADPAVVCEGASAVAHAARAGRGDVLRLYGDAVRLEGEDAVLAACAKDEEPPAEPARITERSEAIFAFASIGNTAGLLRLLDRGVPVNARLSAHRIYWQWPRGTTPLHLAAWHARHDTVAALLARGADVHAKDDRGRTPLELAVRATVDTYWTDRRAPDSVRALLAAGASREGLAPCGYDAVDALLTGIPS